METNPNIIRLLEMLDNPGAYSEQEIRDIINCDEETRETYRFMVTAKQGYRHKQPMQPADVDAAWRRFESNKLKTKSKRPASVSIFYKIAASFIGILMLSGIAFAAIRIVRQYQKAEAPKAEVTENVTSPVTTLPADTLAKDTVTVQPVIYNNIPLEKMLPEIAAHYDVKVIFAKEEACGLRFRFVWNPQQGIEQVVKDLNQFERLTVTLKDNLIIVE